MRPGASAGRRTSITSAGGWQSTTTELRYVDGRIGAEYTSTCDINGCTTPVLSRSYVTDESGAVVKMTIPNGPDAGTYLVTWNGHGDALNLLRIDGGVLTTANSFSYNSWGSATVHTHNGFGNLGFRYRYVGQHGVQDDAVHGLPLLLMGARHYAPELGRFIQPDPSALEDNAYSYAGNNPTRMDPDGTWWFVVWAVVRVAAGVAPLVTRLAPLGSEVAPAIRTAAALGRAGEAAVRAAYRIGPKVYIRVNGRLRIPDGMTGRVLSEVENVQYLSYTQQLRDYAQYARNHCLQFDLYVRSTTRLSGPLADAVRRGEIRLRTIP